jgi:hypothetical protein
MKSASINHESISTPQPANDAAPSSGLMEMNAPKPTAVAASSPVTENLAFWIPDDPRLARTKEDGGGADKMALMEQGPWDQAGSGTDPLVKMKAELLENPDYRAELLRQPEFRIALETDPELKSAYEQKFGTLPDVDFTWGGSKLVGQSGAPADEMAAAV